MHSQAALKQLERFASNDMRMAREEGEITITRTKKGNVTLQYFHRRIYKITQAHHRYNFIHG